MYQELLGRANLAFLRCEFLSLSIIFQQLRKCSGSNLHDHISLFQHSDTSPHSSGHEVVWILSITPGPRGARIWTRVPLGRGYEANILTERDKSFVGSAQSCGDRFSKSPPNPPSPHKIQSDLKSNERFSKSLSFLRTSRAFSYT